MHVNHRYPGQSHVRSGLRQSSLRLAPDLSREPTFFRGRLARPLALREALHALHAVVVSDFRYRPPEREAFKRWLAEQDELFLESLSIAQTAVRERLAEIRDELRELDRQWRAVSGPWYKAQARYFRHLYLRDYQAWVVLDPVITVHPDELFFECFSTDESTYARVGVRYRVFDEIAGLRCGTTNIDFSVALHKELRRMRSYRQTTFELDPGGFGVATTRSDDPADVAIHHEKKIDLPPSWVRGFLEVQAAMTLGPTRIRLSAVDLYELIRVLKAHKAREGPRALVWVLEPGERTRVIVQPWDIELRLSPRSVYEGNTAQRIRSWGRDRVRLLERLLPECREACVHLLGDGMPTFYTVDSGDVTFTLGLSPWTKRDWSKGSGFAREHPDERPTTGTVEQVFDVLREERLMRLGELVARLDLDHQTIRAALRAICAAGRGTYDLVAGVYRHRELFPEPLPWDLEPTATERLAQEMVRLRRVELRGVKPRPGGARVWGRASGLRVELELGGAGEIVKVNCSCGCKTASSPCAHALALWFTQREQHRNQEK